ncbi:hypothetical protein C8R43DRAFT_1089898 [Mycena crocata]|nr:hypothetical protein C8R43DRAFT_1089898 [Mycena crocata]
MNFPPRPLSTKETHNILTSYCNTINPRNFMEKGCAVCGYLVPIKQLTRLSEFKGDLSLLERNGVTRKERFDLSEPIEELSGPILAEGCNRICVECETALSNRVVPKLALARHNWVGVVPDALKDLTFAEGLMIAKIRHNRCVVRVNSGRVRMSANAIMFSSPVLTIRNKLPPSRLEMNEILAFIFTGSAPPTPEEFDRTPMLVRRSKVVAALEWLKLNHESYTELEISRENLNTYKERDIPVVIDFRKTDKNSNDAGTSSGACTFAVHGLTGPEYAAASMSAIKAGEMMGIGRAQDPASMYNHEHAYPGMFPWLFPYGKGGIGHPSHTNKQADIIRKRSLLMYYDKRFQTDTYFPMIAFNHEQMKGSSTAIIRRLRAVNPEVAGNIADRMVKKERVTPVNEAEQDLDGAAGHVMGSVTSKKYQRNEIWSTVSFFNAPTWFVTIAWSDLHHPIALYYAQTSTVFSFYGAGLYQ